MLENPDNQAAGLLAFVPTQGPRLMAVVSHGDEHAELPLLWRICLALVDFGYPVTVLDATTAETQDNPGLEQLLDCAYWRGPECLDALSWTVVPSSVGIQNLCASPADKSQGLQQLGKLFPHDGVVILYSNAEWLVSLMGNSDAEPLLAVSSMKTSLMTSYLALKRLLKNGNIEPTIVNLVKDSRAGAVCLSECAKNFLNYDVKPINMVTPTDDSPPDAEVRRLALRLLESAIPLLKADVSSVPRKSFRSAHPTPVARSY